MREILFRGQTRRYGEKVRMGDGAKVPSHWVYGGVLQGVGSHSIIYGGENVNDPSEGLDKWCVYTDTLGQFIGLTDKNGTKIFEGDVLRYYDDEIQVVEWSSEWSQIMLHTYGEYERKKGRKIVKERHEGWNNLDDYPLEDMPIIGNIYDNPDLLEEDE